ncbi:hypothetical protein KIPB_000433 [Kipferlia bialata]|uniref:Uncharacterized protein n=1 Tax=Kipferlia bialata TaxID=797122 RepID=A0A9K3GEN7_9EUKA|nr:hypothetical protein KIPB_000433 [Kipferlia bialata]|eukprot:g433.t1
MGTDSSLVNANLHGLALDNLDLSGCDMSHADLGECSFNKAVLKGTILKGADLSHCSGIDKKMLHAVADLRETNLSALNFSGFSLKKLDMTGCILDIVDSIFLDGSYATSQCDLYVRQSNEALSTSQLLRTSTPLPTDGSDLSMTLLAGTYSVVVTERSRSNSEILTATIDNPETSMMDITMRLLASTERRTVAVSLSQSLDGWTLRSSTAGTTGTLHSVALEDGTDSYTLSFPTTECTVTLVSPSGVYSTDYTLAVGETTLEIDVTTLTLAATEADLPVAVAVTSSGGVSVETLVTADASAVSVSVPVSDTLYTVQTGYMSPVTGSALYMASQDMDTSGAEDTYETDMCTVYASVDTDSDTNNIMAQVPMAYCPVMI